MHFVEFDRRLDCWVPSDQVSWDAQIERDMKELKNRKEEEESHMKNFLANHEDEEESKKIEHEQATLCKTV